MRNYIGLKAEGMGFDAHLTVLYTGPLDKDRTDAANSIIEGTGLKTLWVQRKNIDLFRVGTSRIPVLLVDYPVELYYLREHLIDCGIPDNSNWNWTPHITLKLDHMKTIKIPAAIRLVNLGFY